MPENKNKKYRFRPALMIGVAVFILLVSFLAYMLDTKLEDVVAKETGSSVITHDTAYDSED